MKDEDYRIVEIFTERENPLPPEYIQKFIFQCKSFQEKGFLFSDIGIRSYSILE